MLAMIFSLGALTVAFATWVAYLATIPGGKVPARPVVHVVAQAAAIGAAVLAVVLDPRAAVIAISAGSLLLAALFLFLLTQRKTPVGKLKVRAGDTLVPFRALTADGTAFTSDQLAGRRVLLKFFRGHW